MWRTSENGRPWMVIGGTINKGTMHCSCHLESGKICALVCSVTMQVAAILPTRWVATAQRSRYFLQPVFGWRGFRVFHGSVLSQVFECSMVLFRRWGFCAFRSGFIIRLLRESMRLVLGLIVCWMRTILLRFIVVRPLVRQFGFWYGCSSSNLGFRRGSSNRHKPHQTRQSSWN